MMRRVRLLYAILFIGLLFTGGSGQSDARKVADSGSSPAAKSDAKKACPFTIIGLWKSDATSPTNPIYYSFAPTGWVTVMGHAANALPQDFEMMAQVKYKLDDPAKPARIEFTSPGKSDTFPRGTSSLEIIQFADDSFTVADLTTGNRTLWERVVVRRYFLTLAARNGSLKEPGPVLAMWTTLDGRKTEVEALGVQMTKDEAGKPASIFGPIQAEIYSEFEHDGGGESKATMRLELTESEFERTQKIRETWENNAKAKALPNADPYLNAMEFLTAVAQSVNQCGEKIKLHRPDTSARDEITAAQRVLQRPLEYIRLMRKKNDELHVKDAMFPWSWRPIVELSPQG